MSSEQQPSLKLPHQGDRNAQFIQVSQNASDGQPLYCFLVQCFSKADPESHLFVEVRIETLNLEAISQMVAEAAEESWRCQQVWLPVQDWLSTGALIDQAL